MLANSIQLAYYTATSSNSELITRFAEQLNRSDYIMSGHTVAARKMLQIYRTFPKRNGLSLGVSKCAVKYTKDVTVLDAAGDNVVMPLIVELSYALPVGYSSGDTDTAGQIIRSIMISGSNILTPLITTLEI